MSGALCFLLGRADTGKSALIFEELKRLQSGGERAVLIVPEQYTYEAERALSDALDGLIGVQVFSFERLCERVLLQQGEAAALLSKQGYDMVIRRAVNQKKNELRVLQRAAEHAGFAASLSGMFTACKRACIEPATLLGAASNEKLPLLMRDKLHDMAILYEETERYLSEHALSRDDAPNAVVRLIPDSFLAGLPVYLDMPERLDTQNERLLETILRCAPRVTVALRLDPYPSDDADLFEPERETYARLFALGERVGARIEVRRLTQPQTNCDPALRHLEQRLFAYPERVYEGKASCVTLFGSCERRAEAESLAEAVLERARAGVRYREMAIVVGDMDAYSFLIERAFARRGIPVFLDRKRPLTGHPAVDTLLSALRFVAGQSASDFLCYVKNGYAGVTREQAEALEVYLTRTGLFGSALMRPFARGDVPKEAEQARAAAAEPLMTLAERLKQKRVGDKVRAVYDFLTDIRMGEALQSRAEALMQCGRVSDMEEHAQVWNLLMTLFEQTDAILGDLNMGREAFLSVLEEGLSGYEVGVIPGTADQVLLGDMQRTRSRQVRALFVVGANEGLLPAPRTDDALFDDEELKLLAAEGSELGLTSARLAARDRLDLYDALSKARETLYVSWAFAGGGSELSPAPIVKRIETLLPRCVKKNNIAQSDALPDCEAAGLTLLSAELRARQEGEAASPRLAALLAYFETDARYEALVGRMKRAGYAYMGALTLGQTRARRLYGAELLMSASRLETFNACPFKHFMRYGLGAKDELVFTERAMDLGVFYHSALEAFVRTLNARGGHWKSLDDAAAFAVVDEILPEIIAKHNDGMLLYNERLRATLFILVATVKQTAAAIVRQMRAGSFEPLFTEARFGVGQPFPPVEVRLKNGARALIGGVIDRVDEARVGSERCVRVVDYKLGGRPFELAGVISGLTLQLPLYLCAAAGLKKRAAGMYYMPVTLPTVREEDKSGEDASTEAFRLSGLTICEPEVLTATERDMQGVSTVLGDVRKSGEDGFSGSVCSQAEFDALMRRARATAEQTLGRMLDGEAEAKPSSLKGRKAACAYCDYRSVCRFDERVRGCRALLYDKISLSELGFDAGGAEHAEVDE